MLLKQKKEKKTNGKKWGLLLLLSALIAFSGVVSAYFSDFASSSASIKVGTLNIEGEYNCTLNGQTLSNFNISNLNPGDVFVFSGQISNVGNKSAWVREVIDFEVSDPLLVSFLEVYIGTYTQSELLEGEVTPELLTIVDSKANSASRVLNGTGVDAEEESGADFTYIGSSSYSFAYTVYFLPTATNEVQGKTFSINILTQALQFRNNNTAIPSESAWQSVSSAS